MIETMKRVLAKCPDARLRLYDRGTEDRDSEEMLRRRIEAAGIPLEWPPAMSYGSYLATFDDVSVGLAPLSPESRFSRGKSFGKLLAYLDRMVPVVLSDTGEPARFFTGRTGLFATSTEEWTGSVIHLLKDRKVRSCLAGAAHVAFRSRLTSAATAARLSEVLLGKVERSQDLRWKPITLQT